MKTCTRLLVVCMDSARDGANCTTDMTMSLRKVNGCQYHIPQYTQADALGLYNEVPSYVPMATNCCHLKENSGRERIYQHNSTRCICRCKIKVQYTINILHYRVNDMVSSYCAVLEPHLGCTEVDWQSSYSTLTFTKFVQPTFICSSRLTLVHYPG